MSPVYCFRSYADEESVEKVMTVAEYDALEKTKGGNVYFDKKVWYRDYAMEQHGGQMATCWPLKSDAAGVHPDQIPEAKKKAAEAGIRIDFTPDGRAILESAKHRKAYCEFRSLYDRNGGYSDPQRRRS